MCPEAEVVSHAYEQYEQQSKPVEVFLHHFVPQMNVRTLQVFLKLLNITKLRMCLNPAHLSPGVGEPCRLMDSLILLMLACGASEGSDLVPAASLFALSHKCFNCPADAQSINYARILNASSQTAEHNLSPKGRSPRITCCSVI